MEYRNATVWDAEKISLMWMAMMDHIQMPFVNATDTEREKFFLDVIVRIKSENGMCMVAEDEGEIVGYIYGYLDGAGFGYSGLIAYGDSIWIDPKYRGKGVGDHLINLFHLWASEVKANMLVLETVFNERLHKIWERKGYKPIQTKYAMEV